ncbi:MAG: glycine cleavage system protein H [Acidobacteria bacterium]|nr:glycine cleavage system protein H [Acidobacteriota bacterium]
MTVILMLIMFSIFLGVDYVLRRKHAVPLAVVAAQAPGARLIPAVVAGFQVPENLSYHPGHTWALRESANLVRVGLDDFASKLTGEIEHVTLPQRGQWIRQGQKVATLFHHGQPVEMVSPVEGVVSEVNPMVLHNAEAACKDPYGEGWLLKVDAPDAATSFRNLLNGTLARSWTEDAARRLRVMLSPGALALAQDGGVAIHDLSTQIPNEEWARITKQFFLA